MIQEELKNKEKDLKGITRQACSLLDTAWTKGYAAGFNDGYATRREADKEAYKRPKGEWKEWIDEKLGGISIYCPNCGEPAFEKSIDGVYRQVKSNFCPNCGADMRGGADNE